VAGTPYVQTRTWNESLFLICRCTAHESFAAVSARARQPRRGSLFTAPPRFRRKDRTDRRSLSSLRERVFVRHETTSRPDGTTSPGCSCARLRRCWNTNWTPSRGKPDYLITGFGRAVGICGRGSAASAGGDFEGYLRHQPAPCCFWHGRTEFVPECFTSLSKSDTWLSPSCSRAG